jgi:hypothetical protein
MLPRPLDLGSTTEIRPSIGERGGYVCLTRGAHGSVARADDERAAGRQSAGGG